MFIGLNCPYFEKRRIVNCENIRKAQITIPKSIITSMKLNSGDKLEVFERVGMICILGKKEASDKQKPLPFVHVMQDYQNEFR